MAAPSQSAVSGTPLHIQRFTGQPTGQMDAVPASVDQPLASPGRPLEPALRQDMEQRFGYDFSRVQVHSGAAAEQSARDVNAHCLHGGTRHCVWSSRFAPGDARRTAAAGPRAGACGAAVAPGCKPSAAACVGQHGDFGDPRSRTRNGWVEARGSPGLTPAPARIARTPQPGGAPPPIHPDAMAFLENKLRQFYEKLSCRQRILLKRNSTIAIGMATVDGEPRLVYTTANNRASKAVQAAGPMSWTCTAGCTQAE